MSSQPEKSNSTPAYQNETELRRRKYIEYRTIGGMNKKDAALAAGFSSSMANNVAAKIETPEVLEAIERLEKATISEIPSHACSARALSKERGAKKQLHRTAPQFCSLPRE